MYITLDAIDFEIFYNFFFVSIDNKKKRKKLVGKSREVSRRPIDSFQNTKSHRKEIKKKLMKYNCKIVGRTFLRRKRNAVTESDVRE